MLVFLMSDLTNTNRFLEVTQLIFQYIYRLGDLFLPFLPITGPSQKNGNRQLIWQGTQVPKQRSPGFSESQLQATENG